VVLVSLLSAPAPETHDEVHRRMQPHQDLRHAHREPIDDLGVVLLIHAAGRYPDAEQAGVKRRQRSLDRAAVKQIRMDQFA
jgi:hypothetical protein